ncbi:MAG: histidine kinase [Planctomycetia bacterium]|nr:histidine kinase [Planctomycetia bacterium]
MRHPLRPSSAVHNSAFDCAVHPDGRASLPEEYPIARALRGEVAKEENLRCRHDGAGESYLCVTSAPIRDASGRIVAAVSTLHDVSERRRSGVKRAELPRRLVSLQDEDRHRIARKLHDQMGQHLTAFLLDPEALKGQTQDRPAAAEALQRLRDLADRVGQDVHRIAFELRPTALDDWGMQTALTNYVSEWSRR